MLELRILLGIISAFAQELGLCFGWHHQGDAMKEKGSSMFLSNVTKLKAIMGNESIVSPL